MTIQRMDNIGIVVDDLDAAVAFFTALGMELEGEAELSGPCPDQMLGLDGVRTTIAMMRTPDGHGKLELTAFHSPAPIPTPPPAPHTLGVHRVMFAVDDLDATLTRVRPHGAELLGEVTQYETAYRLCNLRGPSGIIVALAQQLG